MPRYARSRQTCMCASQNVQVPYGKSEAPSAPFDSARLTTLMFVEDEYRILVSLARTGCCADHRSLTSCVFWQPGPVSRLIGGATSAQVAITRSCISKERVMAESAVFSDLLRCVGLRERVTLIITFAELLEQAWFLDQTAFFSFHLRL